MRARVLPATASDVPRSPSRDDSDATTQPCARVRRISVPSNIFYIEPAGSRVRRNHADSSLTPTDARTGRVHEMTHERPARPSTWLSCALAPDQIRTGIPFEVCDLSYSLLAHRSQLPLPLARRCRVDFIEEFRPNRSYRCVSVNSGGSRDVRDRSSGCPTKIGGTNLPALGGLGRGSQTFRLTHPSGAPRACAVTEIGEHEIVRGIMIRGCSARACRERIGLIDALAGHESVQAVPVGLREREEGLCVVRVGCGQCSLDCFSLSA